jgi:MscS family membrane protein
MFSRSYLIGLLLAVLCIQAAPGIRAQIPGVTTPVTNSASKEPSALPDPLKRETPRGCILGFIRAAGEDSYKVAAEYFQPVQTRHRIAEDDEELASQLFSILSLKFNGPLDSISNDPNGRTDDGLPTDQEKIGGVKGLSEDFPTYLVRIEDEQGRKLWYISRKTLDQVPHTYDSLQFPAIEKHIPQEFKESRFLAMPLWQWIAILLFAPVALLLARMVTYGSQALLLAWRKRKGLKVAPTRPFFKPDPITFALAILGHFWFVNYIGTSILYRLYYRRVLFILFAAAFYWILTLVTEFIARRISQSLSTRGMFAERSIVSLVRRSLEVTIFLFVALTVLRTLGVDVSTALAGVGIGGLALGLGAQKTFENVFGGVSILFDKVIVVGDVCKINNQVGTVEDIGLRSTRLRTGERTLLSIPNGTMATSTIENLRFRDKFQCQQAIRLRYDLSPDHVRYVLEQIRELLRQNPKVEESSARVRFVRFAENALEVELYCYILETDYGEYLATQEKLFLTIMDSLESTGAVVAYTGQTTIVNKDAWVDPEKAKAAKSAMEKAHNPGVPGPNGPGPHS